ncbi:hypothetical protein C0992_012289 [Termitomyces sp. T32_za158]|nr:hypothetical protein C0992_012289 [Termitomyces sp. T32_za158]
MSTIHHGAYWAYVRRAFIAHGETADATAEALNEYPVWFTGITSVSDANAVLADGVIIWRTWIVWGRSWKVAVVPTICTLLTTAFSIIAIFETVTSTTFGAVGVDYATALYTTSLITTAYCTGAIVYRVVLVGKHSHAGFRLRSYRGVIEIVVESSALYFLATLFALIAYVHSGPASEYASAFWTAITGIAPTLVIARVAAGEARPNETWNEPRGGPVLSFLRFNNKNKSYGDDAHTELGTLGTGTTDPGDDYETSARPRGRATWELQLQKESLDR